MDNTFSTRELVLAAALSSLGQTVLNLDVAYEGSKNNPVGFFIFQDSEELQELVRQIRTKKALVEPHAFQNSIRSLKSWVSEATR
jgi:hypothetical protein